MLKKLLFIPLAASLIYPAVSEAADFTGKIKRIRIKKRRVGSGFRVVAVVQNTNASSVSDLAVTGGLHVSLDTQTEGEPLIRLPMGASTRDVSGWAWDDGFFEGDATGGSYPATFTLLNERGDAVGEAAITLTGCNSNCGWQAAGWGETGKVKAKLKTFEDGSATLKVEILNEDRDWDVTSVAGVKVSLADDAEGPLPLESGGELSLTGGRSRFVANVEADLPEDVLTTASLTDADGQVIDTLSDLIQFEKAGIEDRITQSKVVQRKKGDYKIVSYSVTDSNAPLRGMAVTIADNTSEKIYHEALDEAPVGNERQFWSAPIFFDGPITGIPYNVTLSRLGKDGGVVGMPVSAALLRDNSGTLIEIKGGPEAGFDRGGAFACFDDGDEGPSCEEKDNMMQPYIVWTGSDSREGVNAIEIVFEEPFDGPAPQENPVYIPFFAEYHKWVDTFDPNVDLTGIPLSVEQTLFTDDLQIIDGVGWTGEVGEVQGLGKGTTPAMTSISSRPQLL